MGNNGLSGVRCKGLGNHGIVKKKTAWAGKSGISRQRSCRVGACSWSFMYCWDAKVGAGDLLVPLILEPLLGIYATNIKELALHWIHLCYFQMSSVKVLLLAR